MILRVAKLLVSAGIMALVLYLTDSARVLERLGGADLGWLAVSAVSLTIVTLLMALRWSMVAARLGLQLDLGVAIREYYYSNLINQIIPGGVVGDISRAVRQKDQATLTTAAKSVIIERLVGQCILMAILAIGLCAALVLPGGIVWPSVTPWLIGFGAIAVPLILFGLGRTRRAAFLELTEALTDLRQLALSGAISGGLIFGFYACARATGTILPVEAVFTVIPLILSAMIIPLSVGGWGWREGAAAVLFPLAGASSSAGIATGIAYGAILLITALPALAFLLTTSSLVSPKRGLRKEQM